MKRLSLVLLLSSVAIAAPLNVRNFFEWTPITFSIDPSAVSTAMNAMGAAKDPTLKEMEENFPGFRSNFLRAFDFVSYNVLQNVVLPPMKIYSGQQSSAPDERLQNMGYAVGETIERVRSDIIEKVKESTAVDWDDYEKHNYLYCENNPTLSIPACDDGKYSSDWVFARRLISQAAFVRNSCPVFANFAVWNMNWNDHGLTRDTDYRLFFAEIDRVLNLYYNGGVWTHTILGTVVSPLGEDFLQTLERRYLDGGPELMMAMKECLASTYKAYLTQTRTPDSKSSAIIADLLKFQDVPFIVTGQMLSIQSAVLSRGVVHRLARHMDMSSYVPPSQSENYIPMLTAVLLTRQMSQSDPVYNYRLMTRPEYEELKKDNQPIVKRERLCLVSHNYVRDGVAGLKYYEASETEIDDSYEDNECLGTDFAIIREAK